MTDARRIAELAVALENDRELPAAAMEAGLAAATEAAEDAIRLWRLALLTVDYRVESGGVGPTWARDVRRKANAVGERITLLAARGAFRAVRAVRES